MSEKVITVKIRGKAVTQLEKLKLQEGATTHSEVIRNALRVYNTLDAFKDPKDGSIVVETPDGKRVKLIMPQ